MYYIKYSENFRMRLFQLGLFILIFAVLVITPDLECLIMFNGVSLVN
jgi:hypothetical protein